MQCDFKYYIDVYTNDIYWNCVFFSFIENYNWVLFFLLFTLPDIVH